MTLMSTCKTTSTGCSWSCGCNAFPVTPCSAVVSTVKCPCIAAHCGWCSGIVTVNAQSSAFGYCFDQTDSAARVRCQTYVGANATLITDNLSIAGCPANTVAATVSTVSSTAPAGSAAEIVTKVNNFLSVDNVQAAFDQLLAIKTAAGDPPPFTVEVVSVQPASQSPNDKASVSLIVNLEGNHVPTSTDLTTMCLHISDCMSRVLGVDISVINNCQLTAASTAAGPSKRQSSTSSSQLASMTVSGTNSNGAAFLVPSIVAVIFAMLAILL